MRAKLKKITAESDPSGGADVQPQRRSRDIVAEIMLQRKAYYHAKHAAKGRFNDHAELIVYLTGEVAKGERIRREIAADAKIPVTTLNSYVQTGKVPRL